MKLNTSATLFALCAVMTLCLLSGCPGGRKAEQAAQKPHVVQNAAPKVEKSTPLEDGRPGTWPIPELTLPPGADTSNPARPSAEARPFGPGATEWAISFKYGNSWEAICTHLDTILAPLGYERIKGNKNDLVPEDAKDAAKKKVSTSGQKTYISKDRTTFVFLFYTGELGLHSAVLDENYRLQILKLDQPQPVNPPSFAEEIK